MKKLLGIIAVGAIAFGVVTSAAASLTLPSISAPAQGSLAITGGLCDSTSGTEKVLVYGNKTGSELTTGSTVDGITVSKLTCTGEPNGVNVSGDNAASGGINETDGTLTITFTSPETVAAFSDGTYVVTIY